MPPSPKTRPSGPTDEQYVNLVVDRANHSRNHFKSFFSRLARWYDLYRGVYAGRYQTFRNNIHIPFIFSVVQSDVSRKVQATFGNRPFVSFIGTAPEDAPLARKNELLIDAQLNAANSFAKAYDAYLCADLYGLAVIRHGWTQDIRMERMRQKPDDPFQTYDVDGGYEDTSVDVPVVRFDGPDWSVVDPLDFWPQPAKPRVPQMAWIVHRYYMDLDEIRDEVEFTGKFRRSALRQLEQAPMTQGQTAEYAERVSVYRSYQEWEARLQERHAKPIEVWEMWGSVPSDMAPDGLRHRVITVANRKVLLRNEPTPFWHGQIPFIAYSPSPDPHYLHGVGKAEIAEKPQIAANRLANMKLDTLDLFGAPTFLLNEQQTSVDRQNLYLKPGRVIGFNGPVGDDAIRPLIPDLRGLQATYGEIEQMSQWIQQGTGIVEDTVSGFSSSGRQTAREFLGRQEASLSRVMMEARLAEEYFVEPLANAFRMLNRQFLSVPQEIQAIGSAAVINPITGLPMPPEAVEIDYDTINMDFKARAMGATQMLGKAVRQQNLIAVMGAFGSNPVLAGIANWAAFGREVLRTFDFVNPDEFLNTQMTGMNAMGMANGNTAGTPPGPMGAASSGGTNPLQELA